MGTSLNGLTPSATYSGLIKFGDNSAIGASLKYISDGDGNDTLLALSTTSLNIGANNLSARVGIKGSGSTSATTSLLVENSAGNTSLKITDDQQLTGFFGTQLRFRLGFTSAGQGISTRDGHFSIGQVDAGQNAGQRFLTLGSGSSYIDGWSDGAAKAQNYPIFIGSRANNTGNAILNSITQENGNQVVFGSAVNVTSSLVTINSTTRGFLPPRMTNAQRVAISSPAVGLMVYCTDAIEGLYINKSTGWTLVI